MRSIIVAFFCLFLNSTFAQSSEVQAKAAFLKAQEYYGNGEYSLAVEKLEQTKEYLKGSNPKIDYLLTLSYIEIGDAPLARQSLKSYFDKAAETDANYMQMLGIVSKVEELEKAYKMQAEQAAKTLKLQKDEDMAWTSARTINSIDAYTSFLGRFPNGKYATKAREVIGEMNAYDGQIIKRSDELKNRLEPNEYSYIIGSPTYMLRDGMVTLTFERASRMRGSIVGMKININGQQIATIGNGKTVTVNVPSGKMEIFIDNFEIRNYNKILFYPARRNEKFIIDWKYWQPKDLSEIIQHEITYKFEEEGDDKETEAVLLRDQ